MPQFGSIAVFGTSTLGAPSAAALAGMVSFCASVLSSGCERRQVPAPSASGEPERSTSRDAGSRSPEEPRSEPPVPFGYKCTWLAVRTRDTAAVMKHLGLSRVRRSGWTAGIEEAYAGSVFVTPPVGEWTLVASNGLPALGWPADARRLNELLQGLSRRFGEAQYFATHRVSESHAWAIARVGVVVRAYAFVGDKLEVSLNSGSQTPQELNLNVGVADPRKHPPDEEDVMRLAGALSLDPSKLGESSAGAGVGFLGTFP